eukprot:COSAG02_NODE_3684_length_6385_cov_4.179287_7_plen_106_part_00
MVQKTRLRSALFAFQISDRVAFKQWQVAGDLVDAADTRPFLACINQWQDNGQGLCVTIFQAEEAKEKALTERKRCNDAPCVHGPGFSTAFESRRQYLRAGNVSNG